MAKRKSSKAQPSHVSEMAKFRRQDDLRTLQSAEEIQSDSSRMKGAKREAKEQQKALNKIAGRKK